MPKPILYILIFSVLLRIGLAFAFGDAITETRGGASDQISYDALARRVTTNSSTRWSFWPQQKNVRFDTTG